jgi:hypothetical protein
MTLALVLALAVFPQGVVAAQASATPSASPTAASTRPPAPAPTSTAEPLVAPAAEDRAVTKRAREWFHRMQAGDVDRSQLDAGFNAALTDDLIKKTQAALTPLGEPAAFQFVKAQVVDNQIAYYYQLTSSSGNTFYWLFGLDPDGKISGFYLRVQLPD